MRKPGLAALVLVLVVLAAAALLHVGTPAHASKPAQNTTGKPNLSSISVPLFFEPNQGQTDPRVKFLARGSGYGLFLTADEAVLEVQGQPSAPSPFGSGQAKKSRQPSGEALKGAAATTKTQAPVTSIVRMHLEGANPAAKVAGSDLLGGKSNYFIGNDPAKWRRNIPQYARVNYSAVYPGVDLVYYGNQGQLEYDFRVAPGGDPRQIALQFEGASPRLEHGDLVLSTRAGDVRFHAPNVYQQDGGKRRTIEGSFRQLASDKIGFEIGAYDHSRELVIDPTLFYSTYLGEGGGVTGESNVHVEVDQNGFNIYVAGSTTSANFPTVHPIQGNLGGNNAQNIFISQIAPSNATSCNPECPAAELVFSTYLGGSGTDTLADVAVDKSSGSIYVAGTTTSPDFPHTPNAFQQAPEEAGTHGFLSKISLLLGQESLNYSTYLSGNGTDLVTGMAIDPSGNAFVTGTTSSTDGTGNGFPATANAYQTQTAGGATQFFASKINTNGSGSSSMVYSTFFGGSSVPPGFALSTIGGGIAVDATSGDMFFTGGTNFIGAQPPTQFPLFPMLNAQQSCLNEAGKTSNCSPNPSGNLDAFVAKINPSVPGIGGLLYSTFLGGSFDDVGLAIAVDSSTNAYVTGETKSGDWNVPPSLTPFQTTNNGFGDAFIAKLGTLTNGVFPITYFTYLGGSGEDVGRGIAVDSTSAAHVTGWTESNNLPITNNNLQGQFGGVRDAFVGLISTTGSGNVAGDYLTYLGGGALDEGTGIALDSFNATYVAGDTQSGNFPIPITNNPPFPPYQDHLIGSQNAFVTQITTTSNFVYTNNTPTKSPDPSDMGSQETFTFTWVNQGPEAANNVIFTGQLIGVGLNQGFTFDSATATPGGACPSPVNGVLTCSVGTVAANTNLTVTVVLTPTCSPTSSQCPTQLSVSPTLTSPGLKCQTCSPANVNVDDFVFFPAPSPLTQTVTAGGSTSYTTSLSVTGNNNPLTYANAISMSATVTPATSTITTTFTPSSVTISGSGPTTSTLNVTTQPRPVSGGSLWRHGAVYATWLPVGGLSLLGFGVGASRRRRRWIAGALLGLIAGMVLLQGACGNSSSSAAQTGGTPAGTYTIKITGSSGSDSHTAEVTLIVN